MRQGDSSLGDGEADGKCIKIDKGAASDGAAPLPLNGFKLIRSRLFSGPSAIGIVDSYSRTPEGVFLLLLLVCEVTHYHVLPPSLEPSRVAKRESEAI